MRSLLIVLFLAPFFVYGQFSGKDERLKSYFIEIQKLENEKKELLKGGIKSKSRKELVDELNNFNLKNQNSNYQKTNMSDSLALVALYISTNGDEWTSNANWLTGNISEWYGVFTENGRIVEIYLSNNNLTGIIPPEIGDLDSLKTLRISDNSISGIIPNNIYDLSVLEHLDISSNNITSELSEKIGNCTNLKYFFFDRNNIKGRIPRNISKLFNLKIFVGSYNNISGSLPKELCQLNYIEQINLYNNNLSGNLPKELGELVSLHSLDLDYNYFFGEIPSELCNLKNLSYLCLSNNKLTGKIPKEIENLQNLNTLDLSANLLEGEIPYELGKMPKLGMLILSQNNLTGSIPENIFESDMYWCSLSSNNLNGILPKPVIESPRLTDLYITNNQIEGSIPGEFGIFSELECLYLDNNKLSGKIPKEIEDMISLRVLSLSHNNISGEIPLELTSLTNLKWAYLWFNNLTGSIPVEISNMQALEDLHLTYNNLTGKVPGELSNLPNLRKLNLGCNNFTEISEELLNTEKPLQLYLERNDISELPVTDEIKINSLDISFNKLSFEDLEYLNITNINYSNQRCSSEIKSVNLNVEDFINDTAEFIGGENNIYTWHSRQNGILDDQETNVINRQYNYWENDIIYCQVSNPNVPDLYFEPLRIYINYSISDSDSLNLVALFNQTGGENWTNNEYWLTDEILKWHGVVFDEGEIVGLELSGNNLSGEFPIEITDIESLRYIHMLGNKISGSLPTEIGNMKNLSQLNLYNNDMSGLIPVEVGNMENLYLLSLNYNNIGGIIPEELGNLEKLHILQLASNQLVGKVPESLNNTFELVLEIGHNNLIDVPELSDIAFLQLNGNNLTFEDIEPNIDLIPHPENIWQRPFGITQNFFFQEDSILTLNAEIGGSDNHYQWYKEDEKLIGETNFELLVPEIENFNQVNYYCQVSSTVIEDLILESKPFKVWQKWKSLDIYVYDSINPIENAKLIIEGYDSVFSDKFGFLRIDKIGSPSLLNYKILAENCEPFEGNLFVDTIGVVDSILLQRTHAKVKFVVKYDTLNVESALIHLDGYEQKLSDENGVVIFNCKLSNTKTLYSIELFGFKSVIGEIEAINTDIIDTIYIEKNTYDLTFEVLEGIVPVENAFVDLMDYEGKHTNQNGIAIFNDILHGDSIIYSVSKEGYYDVIDTTFVFDSNYEINIVLNEINYSVIFIISDGMNPLDNIQVSLEEYDNLFSNENGIAEFDSIFPTDSLYFEIRSEEYNDTAGYVYFTEERIEKDIQLSPYININHLGENEIQLFPNPANQKLYLEIKDDNFSQYEFAIYNSYGEKMISSIVIDKISEIDISKFNEGFYFVIIQDNKGIISQSKFIKMD